MHFFSEQKAIAIAQRASQEDQEGKYEDAILTYQHAVKYFLHIVKRRCSCIETNPRLADSQRHSFSFYRHCWLILIPIIA